MKSDGICAWIGSDRLAELRHFIESRHHELFELVSRNGTHRKCRLLIAASCRALGEHEIAQVCERVAEGLAPAEELQIVRHRPWIIRFLTYPRKYKPTRVPPSDQLREFVWQALNGDPRFGVSAVMDLGAELLRGTFGQLIREILGNPSVTVDPRWLTASVIDLARTIHDDHAFERLPILADALMDAGCDSEELIDHCRSQDPHLRGCWAVDLLFGCG
jgi:hypothetical protein